MKLSPVFHLKLQHCSNWPRNSAISLPLLHGNVTSASSTLFSRYYAVWNFAKVSSFPPDYWMHVHHVLPSLIPFFFAHWNFSLDLKESCWNFGTNYPSPLQYNGLQVRGNWRRQHIWHWEAPEARVDLQAYGGNPPGQHRMLPTFGHPELSIHPAGSPLPGLAAGTSKLFVWTCKKWSSISMRRNRTS